VLKVQQFSRHIFNVLALWLYDGNGIQQG